MKFPRAKLFENRGVSTIEYLMISCMAIAVIIPAAQTRSSIENSVSRINTVLENPISSTSMSVGPFHTPMYLNDEGGNTGTTNPGGLSVQPRDSSGFQTTLKPFQP